MRLLFYEAREYVGNLDILFQHAVHKTRGERARAFAVENAVEYEFYFLSSDDTWQLIESIGMDDTGAESYTYTFSPRFLNPGEYTVAVRAVGDKEEGWFKSALPGCDAALDTVTVVVA